VWGGEYPFHQGRGLGRELCKIHFIFSGEGPSPFLEKNEFLLEIACFGNSERYCDKIGGTICIRVTLKILGDSTPASPVIFVRGRRAIIESP